MKTHSFYAPLMYVYTATRISVRNTPTPFYMYTETRISAMNAPHFYVYTETRISVVKTHSFYREITV